MGASGCIDSFHGSNVQFDFAPTMLLQAPLGVTPGGNQLATASHFTFYAFTDGADSKGNPVGRLFAVQQLEIHRIVDLGSPCFIDVGAHVPFPGLHVSEYATMIKLQTGIADLANPPPEASEADKIAAATAVTRMANVNLLAADGGLEVISGASTATYPDVAIDCVSPGIPPATCTDDASNKRRLDMCQAFWHANPGYFEGTDRILTEPLNGETHGMVDGVNPINFAPVGGAQFFVNTDLGGVSAYALYTQDDGMPDPGTLVMYGTTTTPTRGVQHVHMASPTDPTIVADAAIFINLDDDSTNF